jgi:hypothetical protein
MVEGVLRDMRKAGSEDLDKLKSIAVKALEEAKGVKGKT